MPPCGVSTLTKTALPSHKGIPVTGQLRIEIVVSYSARMSMLPEIHFNFGQVTFERIYQVFLPLIPGGTLVGGLVLAYPQRVHDAEVTLGLGSILFILENCVAGPLVDHGSFDCVHSLHGSSIFHS